MSPPNPEHQEPVVLRPYREADLPMLFALDQVCFAPGIAYSRDELLHFLAHPSAFAIVAHPRESSETPLGFALVQSARRALSGGRDRWQPVLHIITIDVSPDARRIGVGSALMRWILDQARTLTLSAVVLEVAVDNLSAQGFYARWGFQATGTIPGYYNGTLDALVMERHVESGA